MGLGRTFLAPVVFKGSEGTEGGAACDDFVFEGGMVVFVGSVPALIVGAFGVACGAISIYRGLKVCECIGAAPQPNTMVYTSDAVKL